MKKQLNERFKVGHSAAVSETFIPHFYEDLKNDIVYADIAGLRDTDENIVPILCNFILIYIFRNAKSVRFLMTLTYDRFHSRV